MSCLLEDGQFPFHVVKLSSKTGLLGETSLYLPGLCTQ